MEEQPRALGRDHRAYRTTPLGVPHRPGRGVPVLGLRRVRVRHRYCFQYRRWILAGLKPTRRVVAITGAGGALGAAISQQLASEPATDLVLSDVSAPSLEATVAGLPDADGSVETVLADVSDLAEVESVITLAVERFGRLDVLISNAGVLSSNGRIHNLATEEWERAFRINLLGAVNGIRAAVAVMRPQRSGSIVLTASVSGLTAWSHAAPSNTPGTESASTACVQGHSGLRSTPIFHRTHWTRWPLDIPWGSDQRPISSVLTPTSRATGRAGQPDRRWSLTADSGRSERDRQLVARPRGRVDDPLHEDLGERLRHIASRQRSARLKPQVRVVVHPEPSHGGQPRLQLTELARVDAGLEDRLDPFLVLAAALAELRRPLAGERRELVQEYPDVIRVAVDHVEQFLTKHGQLQRRRAARLGDAISTEHHLVHHPVVDCGEKLLFGGDVMVERPLAEIVCGTELHDARGVIPTSGEDGRRCIDDRLATRLPLRPPWRIANYFGPWH